MRHFKLLSTLLFLLLKAELLLAQFTPPSIAHLKVWLRADTGVVLNGGNVAKWEDQSGNLNDAIQPIDVNQPLFIPNAVNGKPSLRFSDDFTVDHNTYAHSNVFTKYVNLTAVNTINGIGFTINAISELALRGQIKVRYTWRI